MTKKDETLWSCCANCEHYEGIHDASGCAPCRVAQKMVMSYEICTNWKKYSKKQEYNQSIKADDGKPRLSLVPSQIIKDIARVREYGNRKYGDSNSWRLVEIDRYRDALYRHLLAYIEDPHGVDEESGMPHLWHIACNVAFLCEKETYE